jgi:hypothetical protein
MSRTCAVVVAVLCAALAACVSQAPSGASAYTAHAEDAYQKLGLSPSRVEPWEDGMRTTGRPGTYEWWYFDFSLDDGSTLVITFDTKDPTRPGAPLQPFVSFKLDRPDGTSVSRTGGARTEEFSAARDRCDVRLGQSSVSGDLHDYQVTVRVDDVAADLRLHGTVPPWRPGTGYMFFQRKEEHYFAWLPSVPQGTLEGTVSVGGVSRAVRGVGYHDHNWGDASMLDLMHHWYWGRAQIGDYSVIASYITATDSYGGSAVPVFMLARDGKIIAEDASRVAFSMSGVHTDSFTGKPVADVVVYDYTDGTDRYRVTFHRETDLVRDRFVDHLPAFQAFLARLAGFDGAYLRFTGSATVERFQGQALIETANQKAAVWELMYFGHAPKS